MEMLGRARPNRRGVTVYQDAGSSPNQEFDVEVLCVERSLFNGRRRVSVKEGNLADEFVTG